MTTDPVRVAAQPGSQATPSAADASSPVGADPSRVCTNCAGAEWVCENHPDQPWGGLTNDVGACECGAGQPCGVCNPALAAAGRVQPWRALALLAINYLGDAVRKTNWGQPTFGPDVHEEMLAKAQAIEAREGRDAQQGSVGDESAVPEGMRP